ncbi:hypothetical protein MNAN1_001879 [Malassezia nana]|uniref:Uncharacterized protein n=1 Tax=Malassezia nana TaxID=180528 RepID=A0AAF0J7B5_9BASI|nr:hypothetical protein MNAN1_001879 [Malassezia nana]
MDLYDMQQALYEAELAERRRALQREQMRRFALERERQAQAMAVARQMALALAAEEERAKAQEARERAQKARERAQKARERAQVKENRELKEAPPTSKLPSTVRLIQVGPFIWELEVPTPSGEAAEDPAPSGQDAECETGADPCDCDALESLAATEPSADQPKVAQTQSDKIAAAPQEAPVAPEEATPPAPVAQATTSTEEVPETLAHPEPPATEAVPAQAPEKTVEATADDTAAPAKPVTSSAAAPSSETSSQLLFSYPFPPNNTPYGRVVRAQVQSDRIAVEVDTLSGSLQIRGLWSQIAPTSRPSSARSAHVRDVDADGNEVLLPEDTDSESETDTSVTFDQSATLPLFPLTQVQSIRAELNDKGFQLWLDM